MISVYSLSRRRGRSNSTPWKALDDEMAGGAEPADHPPAGDHLECGELLGDRRRRARVTVENPRADLDALAVGRDQSQPGQHRRAPGLAGRDQLVAQLIGNFDLLQRLPPIGREPRQYAKPHQGAPRCIEAASNRSLPALRAIRLPRSFRFRRPCRQAATACRRRSGRAARPRRKSPPAGRTRRWPRRAGRRTPACS